MSNVLPPARPTSKRPVRELLIEAGHDVSAWSVTNTGRAIANPNDNISRNTAWSFPGKDDEPLVVCIWFNGLTITGDESFYLGNDRAYRQRLLDLDNGERRNDVRNRLRTWTSRSLQLDLAIQDAYKRNRPVRLILVDGDDVDESEADRASTVSARSLDPDIWWVHEYDFSVAGGGGYRIVRGGDPPVRDVEEATPDIPDLGDDPLLQEFVQTLDETERDAVIKARVGQGPYRDALFERWGGCSVTSVTMKDLLTASHIKPWSQCETAAERISVSNGLLLVPTLDRLFDRGFITFGDDFKIRISSQLSLAHQRHLGVDPNTQLRLRHFDDLQPYLKWHRERVFKP
ncbi:HNH endonuclease [Paraburkholderia steynii]|uniref:HNH endonuclease n=1 Tax=Paraburkholderia steynii TaxID=1245441 RepID=A0A7Z7FJZ6_9BURK|nr:HNH endonuclease signature motif containing protein [Paraburkholderia steynii]SDI70385.1 HNH endonuclease [Paraburkholderia steynii]